MAEDRVMVRMVNSRGKLLGLALLAVGCVLAVLAYDAQADMDRIGDTTDPGLQDRLDTLEDRRNTLVVSSIGFAFLGLFGVAVLAQPSLPEGVSNAQMVSAARSYRNLARGLSLEGNAVYLPARRGLTKERVLIQASAAGGELPAVAMDGMREVTGSEGSALGVLIDPPGKDLLAIIEDERRVSLKDGGLEAVEGSLQMLKHGLDLMDDFHLKERDGKLVLRVEYDGLREACHTVRKLMPDTCRQIQCVGCSCVLLAVARATGKAVRVETVDNSADRVVFTTSLQDW